MVPATLLRRGVVISQVQAEQHQAMKSSPSMRIIFFLMSVYVREWR